MTAPEKPLGRKAYGSIPHLSRSRLGPGDHRISEGQEGILLGKWQRSKGDMITITEKMDGSCTAVAKHNGQILALQRNGMPAASSPYRHIQEFAVWVACYRDEFDAALEEGQRLVGEWMILAHGLEYNLPCEPWMPFDLMTINEDDERAHQGHYNVPDFLGMIIRLNPAIENLFPVSILEFGIIDIDDAMKTLEKSIYRPTNGKPEGLVYRCEHHNRERRVFDFMAKYVRPDKVDGELLPEISGRDPIWNTFVSERYSHEFNTEG